MWLPGFASRIGIFFVFCLLSFVFSFIHQVSCQSATLSGKLAVSQCSQDLDKLVASLDSIYVLCQKGHRLHSPRKTVPAYLAIDWHAIQFSDRPTVIRYCFEPPGIPGWHCLAPPHSPLASPVTKRLEFLSFCLLARSFECQESAITCEHLQRLTGNIGDDKGGWGKYPSVFYSTLGSPSLSGQSVN